ncbi:MAG TPA: tRNA pseudouridine(55) synthase TruB [Thermoanaerobaculia bacterium]|nr:tRNA pseudouridine(55) synthase TruB [Thermoanaerobaculia bacterium]
MTLDGLLLVDKAPGGTSHDVVQQARRLLRQKRIGHCGTLDPDATGLLLLTLGQATRLTRFLIHAPKLYEGVIRFGVATDTYDAAGRVVAEKPIDDLSESAVDQAMTRFVGTFDQTLPAFSARKLGGVKFYELARRGEEVPETTKEVTVAEFARTGPLADGNLPFRLSCSSGTYARALAHDLGAALGCGGHLAALRRSAIGPFLVEDALPVEEIGRRREAGDSLGAAWLPLDRIPLPFQEVVVDPQQERRLRSGQTVLAQGIAAVPGDWIRLADRRGALVAVGTVSDRVGAGAVVVVQPRIVFRTEPDMVGSVRT